MSYGLRALFPEMQSVDATTITSTTVWTLVGTVPHSLRMLMVDNSCSSDLQFSIDNTSTAYKGNFNVFANTQAVYDLSSNQVLDQGLWLANGVNIYARRLPNAAVPTDGNVYVGGVYGKGD